LRAILIGASLIVTNKDNQPENVVDLAAVKRAKTTASKPRHVRKQEARAEKARKAEANRVRSGRSKEQKARDRAPTDKLHRFVDASHLDKTPDTDTDS
jgi:hypothetical protein